MKTLIKISTLLLCAFCTSSYAKERELIEQCTIPFIVNRSIADFSGDTLILGCGHKEVDRTLLSDGESIHASHKHENEYTIDVRSDINPDLVASIADPETHAYLRKYGKGKFKRIILEHVPLIFSYDECLLTLIHDLLLPGGIVVLDVIDQKEDDFRDFWDWLIDDDTEKGPCYLSLHLQIKYITDYFSYYLYMGNLLRSIGFSTLYFLEDFNSDLSKIDMLKDIHLGESYSIILAYREDSREH